MFWRGNIDTAIKDMCDKYDLLFNRNGQTAGNLSYLTLVRGILGKGDGEYFECIAQGKVEHVLKTSHEKKKLFILILEDRVM